ncbi:MAG: DUF4304 domain-containing protein [Armatimonadetes bacterium]|nr:DUF4304 domain-containing protein [Armatimonadota bacterium]
MISALEERFKTVIHEALTSTLTPQGFRRRGRVYVRRLEDLAWMMDVQRSRYNTREEIQFTINCGVYVPHVLSTYLGLPEPISPTSVDCCISARIGMLSEDRLDKWWTLRDQAQAPEDEQAALDVRKRITRHVLPFLERFPSTREVAVYLERPRPRNEGRVSPHTEAMAFGCAGIVHLLRGERETAHDVLAKAVLTATGTPAEEHVRSLAQRLLAKGLLA